MAMAIPQRVHRLEAEFPQKGEKGEKTRAGTTMLAIILAMIIMITTKMAMTITWTTLTTTKRERGRETMMRNREKTVRRREHTPGPSSQAGK